MMNGKLGFGLVGTGLISETHYLALKNQKDCYLVGCYSHNPEKAEKWAVKHNCKNYTTYEAMLSDPEIDAVSIITPPGCHMDYAMKALRAGKHVLVEKPIEIHADRVTRMISEARENNVILSCIFQSRFRESSLLVRKAVEEGRFGKISICDAQVKWYRDQAYYDSGDWRGTWELDGGGVMMQQSIHAVDLLLFLMGQDPVEVSAYTSVVFHDIEVEDTAVAILRFPDGVLGVLEGTTCSWPGSLKRIEICGSEGQVVLEEDAITKWQFRNERPEDEEIRKRFSKSSSAGGSTGAAAIDYFGHEKQYADVASAIRMHVAPFVSGDEALRSVRVIEGLYRSAKEGTPVGLSI